MVFKPKVDTYYMTFVAIIIFILALTIFTPLFFIESENLPVIIILCFLFGGSVFLIYWSTFRITYIFYEDYLCLKGGLFQSKLRYEEITKVIETTDILTGYRIMSAKDGIEVFYRSGLLGSVKITPLEADRFIEELVKRAPQIEVKA